jgi:hypothetical protein
VVEELRQELEALLAQSNDWQRERVCEVIQGLPLFCGQLIRMAVADTFDTGHYGAAGPDLSGQQRDTCHPYVCPVSTQSLPGCRFGHLGQLSLTLPVA